MNINNFIKTANCALFYDFSKGFEIDVIFFALSICLVFIKMENIIIATGTKIFCVNINFSFASFAYSKLWLPFDFFITSVTKIFCVVFFFLITVDTFSYHNKK